MKKKVLFISIFLFLAVLFMYNRVEATNVLFVGNSKTYYNDFPTMFKKIANSADSNNKVYIKEVTRRWKKFKLFIFIKKTGSSIK